MVTGDIMDIKIDAHARDTNPGETGNVRDDLCERLGVPLQRTSVLVGDGYSQPKIPVYSHTLDQLIEQANRERTDAAQRIRELRGALQDFRTVKASMAADAYDGVDSYNVQRLEEADERAKAALGDGNAEATTPAHLSWDQPRPGETHEDMVRRVCGDPAKGVDLPRRDDAAPQAAPGQVDEAMLERALDAYSVARTDHFDGTPCTTRDHTVGMRAALQAVMAAEQEQ